MLLTLKVIKSFTMKKFLFIISLILTISTLSFAYSKPPLASFLLSDVRLLPSPFLHAQELNKKYLLELDVDRLLAPFLREAGLTPKAESYTNWENTGLDGHIGGHYLSALSLMYASTGDKQIKERLDYMIGELKRCQDVNGNGYIGGVPGGNAVWQEIKEGRIDAHGFSLNGKWVPLYNIHKTYAGLKDAWIYTNNKKVSSLYLDGRNEDNLIALRCKIPEEMQQAEKLTVRFSAQANATTAKIAEVSILSDKITTHNMVHYKEGAEEKDFAAYLFTYFLGNRVE